MAKKTSLHKAKEETVRNLEEIQSGLNRCVEQGMLDPGATYYNEILTLIDEARISEDWDELMEVVTLAKILEVDVAAWMAGHGQTTVSLPWPRPESEKG
jgi:hypothetical protein